MMESTPDAGLQSGGNAAVLVDSTDVENGGGAVGLNEENPSDSGGSGGGGMCCNLCGGQPTLWTLIATEEWEQVRERLATRQGAVEVMGEDFSGFSVLASAVSYEPPLDVVQSIVRMNPKAVSSCGLRGLPIHFASEFGASTEVIRFLIGRHPDSVRQTDHRGRTPLHLAVSFVCMQEAQHGYEPPLDSVVALCRAAPEAIRMLDASGDTPIEVAMKYAAKNTDGGRNSSSNNNNSGGNGAVSSACLGKLSSIFFQFLSDDGLPDFDGEDVTAEDDDVSSDLTVSDDEDFGTQGDEEEEVDEEEVLLGDEEGANIMNNPNYTHVEHHPQPNNTTRRKSSSRKPQRGEEGGEETRIEEVRELMQWRRRQSSTKSSVLPADLRNTNKGDTMEANAPSNNGASTGLPTSLKKTPSGSAAA